MDMLKVKHECGLCHRMSSVLAPDPEIVLVTQMFEKNYQVCSLRQGDLSRLLIAYFQGAPLCRMCYDKENMRFSEFQEKNKEVKSPNTSSNSSGSGSGSGSMERESSLEALMGSSKADSFSVTDLEIDSPEKSPNDEFPNCNPEENIDTSFKRPHVVSAEEVEEGTIGQSEEVAPKPLP